MCTHWTHHCTLTGYVGQERVNFLGKDDKCEALWPSTCIIYQRCHYCSMFTERFIHASQMITKRLTEYRSTWGESNSPGLWYFCVQQFMQFSLFGSLSCSLAFSFYLLAFPGQDEMPRKEERLGPKKIITWTAVHRNSKFRNYKTRLCTIMQYTTVFTQWGKEEGGLGVGVGLRGGFKVLAREISVFLRTGSCCDYLTSYAISDTM